MADATAAAQRPISAANFALLTGLRDAFRAARGTKGSALGQQASATAESARAKRTARLWIRHFIHALNMAIERGEMHRGVRAFYHLTVSNSRLPAMETRWEILRLGQTLASGEATRVAAGGAPITYPSIAQVLAKVNEFAAHGNVQSTLLGAHREQRAAVKALRPAVDRLVRDLWDEIEFNYRQRSAAGVRRKARAWGVVYSRRPAKAGKKSEGSGGSVP